MNLLARLGFSTAKTPDALEYARGELAKLVEISNQSTELTRHIEALNLRKINTLGSRFDTNDITLDYDELLERISQTTAREGEGDTLQDAASYLRGSSPTTTSEQKGSQAEQGEASQGNETVLEYAKENGLLVDDKEFQDQRAKRFNTKKTQRKS